MLGFRLESSVGSEWFALTLFLYFYHKPWSFYWAILPKAWLFIDAFIYLFLIEVELIYNVVLVSSVQQSDSDIGR